MRKPTTFHFHSFRSASGCDGPIESEDVVSEFAGETGRLAWNGYVSMLIGFHTNNCHDEYGPQTMRRWTDKFGTERLIRGGPADEGGYDWEELSTCFDEHCLSPRYRAHYRDVFAEAAGY